MQRPTVLLIVPFTAFPTNSGGRQRILHAIEQMSKKYRLTVWSFVGADSLLEQESVWLEALGVEYRFFELGKESWLATFLQRQPYWFTPWWNEELVGALAALKLNQFKLIQIEGTQLLYLSTALRMFKQKVFVAYDISTLSFWRRMCGERNYLKKLLQLWRVLEIYLYERLHLPKFEQVIAMSEHDAVYLQRHFAVKQVRVLPNGIAQVSFLPVKSNNNKISLGYIGAFTHPPNQAAVSFLITQILPALESAGVSYELVLAGEQDPKLLQQLLQQAQISPTRLRILGYVAEAADFYRQIDLLVAPIFAGSGTRVKILESLSYGRPVVTTQIGAEGIEIVSPFLKILAKSEQLDPVVWLKEILDFVNSNQEIITQRNELKKQLEEMTWEKVFDDLYGNFEKLL